MTFIEAAIEVLRREGRPLHYEKITELAIKYNILSHVGKNPEATMATRLAIQARGNRPQGPLVRLKPGIFALHEWKGNPPGPRKLLPHEMIQEAHEEPQADHRAEPQETNEPEAKQETKQDNRRERAKEVRDNKDERNNKEDRNNRDERNKEDRNNKDERSARDNRREESKRDEKREPRRREPFDKAQGNTKRRSLVEVAEETLRSTSDNKPKTLKQLMQAMPEHQVDTQIAAAAITVDNARKHALGLVPTFSLEDNAVALTEWSSRKKATELDQELCRIAQERNEELFREISAKISALRGGVLEHWVTLALENAGFGSVRLMRRSSLGNFVVVARSTQNLSSAKVLAMVRCQGASITAKDVSDLRANLESYRAQSAIFISFTGISDGAINEAAAQSPAVVLWDETIVARLLAMQVSINQRVLEALS